MALAAVVLLAVGVRLAGLGDTLSADEGYTWLVADSTSSAGFLDAIARFENTPPLYYLLAWPLPVGDDEVWLRLPALLAGVASVPVLYAAVRALASERAALLAALGLAVAPFHVSFSDYGRGFTLAALGVTLSLWACARLATGGRGRWWWLYACGAVVALYAEYDSALVLAPMAGALAVLGARPWREVVALGAAPFLSLLLWLPEYLDGRDFLDITKVSPVYPGPTPASLRDVAVPLFLGESGSADGAALRTLEFLAIAAVLTAAVWLLARARARTTLWLFGGAAAGGLLLHAFVALVGPDIFETRYLVPLIPPSVALLAIAIDALEWRPAVPVAAAAALALGVAIFIQREGRELEPNPAPVRAALEESRPGVALTNSAVAAWYLQGLPVILDRPFGLGRGEEPPTTSGPYAVVDDERVGGGVRPGPGRVRRFGDYVVRLTPGR